MYHITIDVCASVICSIPGETCQGGICKCGTSESCHGNPTASTCDAAKNRCICGSIGFSSQSCPRNEICRDGGCMCGSNPGCERNANDVYCDSVNGLCTSGTLIFHKMIFPYLLM